MSDIQIIIRLPEELVERAQAVGILLEDQTGDIVSLLEAQIQKREAGKRLRDLIDQIDKLPDEIKPTPEDIEAEIRAYHTEKLNDQHS
jgi:Txe/YoeB family toxin of Txe-Axe toxin-antitoxin module